MDTNYSVRVIDGKQFIFYKGEILPKQMETTVSQDANMALRKSPYCEVTVKVLAKLEDSK